MSLRVALISDHASPLAALGGVDFGGQNVYVGQVARRLARLGFTVDVFTRRDAPNLPAVVTWLDSVRVIHVPAGPACYVPKEQLLPHMREFGVFLRRYCREHRLRYDVVHANFWMSGLVASDFKLDTGTPFVVTFHALGRVRRKHQGGADGFPDARLACEDRVVEHADAVIAECPQDQEDLICLYQANPRRLRLIPCGFDRDELWPIKKSAARSALGLATDQRILLQLGRMVPRKGIDTVVRALALLKARHGIAPLLLIVGGERDDPDPSATPEIGRLLALAHDLGVASQVRPMGRRSRNVLRLFYSAADLFITTPWYEPFGITPVEAMACATPVIGANVGGIKFSVRDGETGYLVPPDDPDAIAERAAHLYAHPPLLQLFRRQAVRRANDLFTWDRVTRAIADLYEDVVHDRANEIPSPPRERALAPALHERALVPWAERAATGRPTT